MWSLLSFLAGMPFYAPLSLLAKSLGVRGYNAAIWKHTRPDLYRADLKTLLDMLSEGRIAPVIAARLPLERAAEAHTMLNNAAVSGKIVLEP